MTSGNRAALVIADVQNDFCAGGTLPVPDADRIISTLNNYIAAAVSQGVVVYAVRDWHPAVTTHFQAYGGPWPVHCVQGTNGARFHADLRLPADAIIVTKGTDPNSAGYSAFDGRTSDDKLFLSDLRERGIQHLYIGGVATDYCVKETVLNALSAGLQVTVLEDAIAGVEPGASARAVIEMRKRGAEVAGAAPIKADAGNSGGSSLQRA